MDLKELVNRQREFDRAHGWDWHAIKDQGELLKILQYEIIAICGEVGETANALKKYLRDESANIEHTDMIAEELTPEIVDIFIYLLKIASTLDIDLETAFFAKMAQNKERFLRFEDRHS